MSRKSVVFTKERVEEAMRQVKDHGRPEEKVMSRYHAMKVLCLELGLTTYSKSKNGKRGRPAAVFALTDAGKRYVKNLKARDKRAQGATATEAVAA